MTNGAVQVATEVGRVAENPRRPVMRSQLAILVRGGSVTTHCPAATALPTREYQRDHRRQQLTSIASCIAQLDISFHI
jgi:hypothetical protein